MKGLVLAAGAATRMPNKCLLPMLNGKPVIASAIEYLETRCDEVCVLVSPNSVIIDVVSSMYPRCTFMVQKEHTGVGDALRIGLSDRPVGPTLVCCGDNVYPDDGDLPSGEFVITRKVPQWRMMHLAYVREDKSIGRSGRGIEALTTPWSLTKDTVSRGDDIVDILNARAIDCVLKNGEGWWDVGTPDAYTAYWRS